MRSEPKGSRRKITTKVRRKKSLPSTKGGAKEALQLELKFSPGAASKTARRAPNIPNIAISVMGSLKADQTIPTGNGRQLLIGGLRTTNGDRYVWVRHGRALAVMPYGFWHAGSGEATAALRDQGVTIIGSMSDLRQAVAKLTKFPLVPLVTKPGWCPHGFALADGRVFVPSGQRQPLKTLTPVTGFLGCGGSLEGWRERVATPIAGHHFASYFMMVMFAAPLLHLTDRTDNFMFEIAGPAGRGKSTLQLLMASVAGPAIGGDGTTYWRSCNSTMAALETVMRQYNDLPLILDEAGLVEGGGKIEQRAFAMREMAFRLSQGVVRHRFGEPVGSVNRLIGVLSTNRPLSSLLGVAHAAEAEAIADRLMTVPLLDDREFGIFDTCPDGFDTTGAFVETLRHSASEHYGHALPAFLQYLVQADADDPARLRRRIASRVDRFVTASRIDANDGSQARVAKAFGLVYAAGKLAIDAGILPPGFPCSTAAMKCFSLHRVHGRSTLSFDDRLQNLMRRPDVIDVEDLPERQLQGPKHARCPVFLYTGRSKNRELLVTTRALKTLIPDWNEIRHEPDVIRRLLQSPDRNVVHRPVGRGGKLVSVYCFDVTGMED